MSLPRPKRPKVFDLNLSDLCCPAAMSIGALGQVPSIDPTDSGSGTNGFAGRLFRFVKEWRD